MRLLSALVLTMLFSCAGSRPRGPAVRTIAFAPTGTTEDLNSTVEFTFSAPVVAEDAVGDELPEGAVRVSPALRFRARFTAREVLQIEPLEPLRRGTRYSIELSDEFPAQLDEEDRQREVVVAPLALGGIERVRAEYFPPQAAFDLTFNLDVTTENVAEHCGFRPSEGERIGVEWLPTSVSSGRTITLRPVAPLQRNTAYMLDCAGLTAVDGNHPLSQEEKIDVRVIGPLRLVSSTPEAGETPGPDRAELSFRFSTPIDMESFRQAIRVTPEIPDFASRWVDRGDGHVAVVLNLEALTDYRISLATTLKDEFEQSLGEGIQIAFRTADAEPALFMERGVYAVEASGQGYGVWARNVSSFDVTCATVPTGRVADVLTGGWTNTDPPLLHSNAAINWQELRLRPRTHRVQVERSRNWSLHHVDLASKCGSARSTAVIAEVTSADLPSEPAASNDDDEYGYGYGRPRKPRVFANITDLGVFLKVGPLSGLVWVTNARTGETVSGARVTLQAGGRRTFTGTTDADGMLRLPDRSTLAPTQARYEQPPIVVTVEHAGDTAVVHSNWQNGIQLWNFGLDQEWGSEVSRLRGFVMSDRGIYRPGETVHLKGFLRDAVDGERMTVPTGTRVSVSIEANGEVVREARTIDIDTFGGFDFDYEIPQEAALGTSVAVARVGTAEFRSRFEVQEFKPLGFEIVASGQQQAVSARPTELTFNARHLFGAPLQGANYEWDASIRSGYFRMPAYRYFSFSSREDLWGDWWGDDEDISHHASGDGMTDANGAISFSIPAVTATKFQELVVAVRVTDETGQTISKRVALPLHPQDTYFGLHAQEYVQAQGMPFAVNILAASSERQLVDHPATLKLVRRRQQCEGVGPARECRWEDEVVSTKNLSLQAGGPIVERIVARDPGEYLIRVEGRDRAGRPISASTPVLILGENEAFWSGDESARMALLADKQEYAVGDNARIIPRLGLGGTRVLLTTERAGILSARVVQPHADQQTVFEVPLTDLDVPNVYVSAVAVRPRTGPARTEGPVLKVGMLNLSVGTSARRLDVQVQTERSDYAPGEHVRGTIHLSAGGAPVVGAVALSVADEGVLQLIQFKTPDPFSSFYEPRGISVQNATNWNRFAIDRAPADVEDSVGEDSGGEDADMRSRFVSSAFWNASLVTDAAGNVPFEFDAPDNLTAFRLMAVAVDQGDRFGSGERRIQVKKDLLVQPIVPRFLQTGDSLEVGAVVHNYTSAGGRATVRLRAPGLTLNRGEQVVEVAANSSRRVIFQARVTGTTDETRFELQAQLASARDGMRITVPIRADREFDTIVVASGRADGTQEVPFELPADADVSRSRFEVSVDQSGFAEVERAMRTLVEYPYGCLEQTSSRMVALALVKSVRGSLSLPRNGQVQTYLQAGVDKLWRMQRQDGSFSYWEGGQAAEGLTSYALWALHHAKQVGVRVDARRAERSVVALRSWVNAAPTREASSTRQPSDRGFVDETTRLRRQAFAAYVLAIWRQSDTSLEERLFQTRGNLDLMARAHLLLALQERPAARSEARTLAAELEQVALPGGRITVDPWELGNDATTASMVLLSLGLLQNDPNSVASESLFQAVLRARRNSEWASTYDNAHALWLYSRRLSTFRASATTVRINVDGERLLERPLSGAVMVTGARALSARTGVVRMEGNGSFYYSARLVVARPLTRETVSRRLSLTSRVVDPRTGAPIAELQVGQMALVDVEVSARPPHLAIVVPLPSGVEAVNTALASEGVESDSWWGQTEFRDDEVRSFSRSQLSFLIRATNVGTFQVPGAYAHPMYQPEVFARAPVQTFTVRPHQQ